MIHTGIPLRSSLKEIEKNEACEYLGLDKDKKTVLVIGGSQGSEALTDILNKIINFILIMIIN